MKENSFDSFNSFVKSFKDEDFDVVVLCGLPGSGKSSLGEILRDDLGFRYLSSDKARVDVMKLAKAKFATNDQYVHFKSKVYEYMRDKGLEFLKVGERVVFDATHLNEQRFKLLKKLKQEGYDNGKALIVYVSGGDKKDVRKRFVDRAGKNADGRSWEKAWEEAYDFFIDKIKKGEVEIPEDKELGYSVVEVKNYNEE